MKKIFGLILAVMLCVCAFAGCGLTGGGDKPSDDDGKVDLKKFPYYKEVDEATYKFDLAEQVTPYYKGNVIYTETVLLEDDGTAISGKLQYTPVKVLSVRDYTWKTEYSADKYTVDGKTISITKESGLPYLTSANIAGTEVPEGYRLVSSISNVNTDCVLMGGVVYSESSFYYGHQIQVSYVYDVKDLKLSDFASYETSGLEKTKEKLTNGEPVKIVVTGDSVGEGCSSSSHFNHEPYFPTWAEMIKSGLESKYDSEVTLDNQAVGGMTSDWGSADAQTAKMKNANPDLLIIHFGINDCGGNNSANAFKDNIEKIIMDVQGANPDCEVLIIKAFTTAPTAYNTDLFEKYWSKMDSLASSIDNVYTLDMWTQSLTMLETKKYVDVTGNGINHLNDYSARLYAMNILASLVDY